VNLPNRLTLMRVALVPVICVLVGLGQLIPAAAVFVLAALTDFLDGHIARKRGLITTFGKFMDPVADKLLVLLTMIMLTEAELLPGWAVCVVAARELFVDGLRLVAAGKGRVVAAGMPGKIKTNLQFFCILSALLLKDHWVTLALTVAMAVMTVVSGGIYFVRLRDCFGEETQHFKQQR